MSIRQGPPSRYFKHGGGTPAVNKIGAIFGSFKTPVETPDETLLLAIQRRQRRGKILREIAEELQQPIDKVRAIILANLERRL